MNAFARFLNMVMESENKNTPEPVTFAEFMKILRADVEKFQAHWIEKNKKTDYYPMELPSLEDWREQWIIWQGTSHE